MADQLFLSLWYPNFRLVSLGPALVKVMEQFAAVSGFPGVRSASAYPISWNEAPAYQRIYDISRNQPPDEEELIASQAALAVPSALELLHDDFAYEFEMTWELWVPEAQGPMDPVWQKEARTVRIVGFGPEFDEGAFEQNGHIRVDLGSDTAFLHEGVDLDDEAIRRVKENVKMLVDFTNGVQHNCGISSRLLWSESGESLAQKLIARLQQVN